MWAPQRQLCQCPTTQQQHGARRLAPFRAGRDGWTGKLQLGKKKNESKQKEKPQPSPDAASARPDGPGSTGWRQAVVQVLTRHTPAHPVKPWLEGAPAHSSSSGLLVNAGQGLVLTTAGAVHAAEWDAERETHVVRRFAGCGAQLRGQGPSASSRKTSPRARGGVLRTGKRPLRCVRVPCASRKEDSKEALPAARRGACPGCAGQGARAVAARHAARRADGRQRGR